MEMIFARVIVNIAIIGTDQIGRSYTLVAAHARLMQSEERWMKLTPAKVEHTRAWVQICIERVRVRARVRQGTGD